MKNQEKMKEILEQLRSKENGNNVAKASVEENMMENRNSRSITQGEEEEMFTTQLSTSLASLTTYSYQTSPDNATTVGSGGAIIGLMPPNYYFAEFRMTLESMESNCNLTENELTQCYLSLYPENVSDGYCAFTIVNSEGDTVFTWNNNNRGKIELLIEDVYDYSTEEVYFRLMPVFGINGMVGFPIEDMFLSSSMITDISVIMPPKKTAYLEGQPFDFTDMVVAVEYNNGIKKVITDYTASVSGFNSNVDSPQVQTVTLDIAWDEHTATTSMNVAVNKAGQYMDLYYDAKDELQKMDINVPFGLSASERRPVVITIHGGSWFGGDKSSYDYITEFITNATTAPSGYTGENSYLLGCNCVHVNMNYRLTEGYVGGNNITYVDMLADIQSVIKYLKDNASTYHINTSKIALMGHSAGGHLALLYAYKNPTQIDLVISEAGPTCFATSLSGPRLASDTYIQAMVGSNNTGDLYYASPLTYANSDSPYTVLAYGNGLPTAGYTYGDENGNGIFDDGDGFVPFTQATILQNVLGENDYSLFELTGVGHNDFGEGTNNKKIYPTSNDPNSIMYFSGLQDAIEEHLKE